MPMARTRYAKLPNAHGESVQMSFLFSMVGSSLGSEASHNVFDIDSSLNLTLQIPFNILQDLTSWSNLSRASGNLICWILLQFVPLVS